MIVFVEPREMKLRHTAALALVGWYLVAPPTGPDGKLAAPLPQSILLDSFDSATDNEALKGNFVKELQSQEGKSRKP
jgi:hypothetical protein